MAHYKYSLLAENARLFFHNSQIFHLFMVGLVAIGLFVLGVMLAGLNPPTASLQPNPQVTFDNVSRIADGYYSRTFVYKLIV